MSIAIVLGFSKGINEIESEIVRFGLEKISEIEDGGKVYALGEELIVQSHDLNFFRYCSLGISDNNKLILDVKVELEVVDLTCNFPRSSKALDFIKSLNNPDEIICTRTVAYQPPEGMKYLATPLSDYVKFLEVGDDILRYGNEHILVRP
ncbi:MAG: hypothetical protein PHG05_02395 [Candidatus Nanoarchaeia archaeon]|nr:hypothetical protein [Candidatus Nanoarchaeia archaeon]